MPITTQAPENRTPAANQAHFISAILGGTHVRRPVEGARGRRRDHFWASESGSKGSRPFCVPPFETVNSSRDTSPFWLARFGRGRNEQAGQDIEKAALHSDSVAAGGSDPHSGQRPGVARTS